MARINKFYSINTYIDNDKEFNSANQMLQRKSKNYATQDYANPPKKDAISDSDLNKIVIFLLNQVYDTSQNLQYATWFPLFHFFAKSEHQNWEQNTIQYL